jgi:hypothetical protein
MNGDREDRPWMKGDAPPTDPLARLEEIRSWVDASWPADVTNTQWTWLMIDLGEIQDALRAEGR